MTPRLHAASRALLVAPDDPAVQAEADAALREDAASCQPCEMPPVDLYVFARAAGLLLPRWEGYDGVFQLGLTEVVATARGVKVRAAASPMKGDPVPARDVERAESVAARLRALYPQAEIYIAPLRDVGSTSPTRRTVRP